MPVMFSERFVSNWDLSTARASSVAAAFIMGSGISQSRVVVAGFSDSKPLESNATKEGRAKNRRIEIIVSAAASKDLNAQWMIANPAQKAFQCGWLPFQIWQFY